LAEDILVSGKQIQEGKKPENLPVRSILYPVKTVYNHRQMHFFDKVSNKFKIIQSITFGGYFLIKFYE